MNYNRNTVERLNLINEIIDYFSRLEALVKIHNSNGLIDINGLSEDFFCRLLNLIFDLELINLNAISPNFPSIDLGDTKKRISFQVTSEKTKDKIDKTIEKFNKHKLSSDFDFLRFMIIASKKSPLRAKITSPNGIDFDSERDIYDLSDLVQTIRPLGVEKIANIAAFLRSEFDSQKDRKSEDSLASEVETIADLIVFLSSNKLSESKEWTEEPDPEKKIEHRFSTHSSFLKSEIVDLLPRYSFAKSEVSSSLGIDSIKVGTIRDFLRTKSDIFLTQAAGDPKLALANLTEYFSGSLSASGKKYDYLAIRFYLLDELIKCNVFPN